MPDNSYYNASGAAAAAGIQEFLTRREESRRQDIKDKLALRKQLHDEKMQADDMALQHRKLDMDNEVRKAQVESIEEERRARREDLIERARQREVDQIEQRISGMVKGDIPDAEMLAHADKMGMGGTSFPKPPMQQQSLPGVVAPNAVPLAMRIASNGVEPPTQVGLTPTSAPAVRPFVGTRDERLAEAQRGKQQAFIDAIPQGDARRQELQMALQAEQAGLKVPPGFFAKQQATKSRFMFDPIKGKYMDATGKPVTELPDDAVVDRMAEPRDTSARDAAREGREATREASRATHVDAIREHAYSELITRAKPVEEQISNLNKLDTSLDQDTPIADSTLAEQIIKITAGGAGSGVRITTPEILQVLDNSKTRWQVLQQTMEKWSLDPKKAQLFLRPEQKADLRKLTRAIRTKANKLHEKIIKARRTIDEADDVRSINNARSDIEEALAGPIDATVAGTAPITELPPGVTVKRTK